MDKYRELRKLGSGAYGTVYRARRKGTGQASDTELKVLFHLFMYLLQLLLTITTSVNLLLPPWKKEVMFLVALVCL